MLALARSEITQIIRNRLVLVTGLVIPVAVGGYFVHQHEVFSELGSLGYIAAIVVFTVMSFGLYTTAVTTLASRRQNLFLKRLRSTAADDVSILTGLLLPTTVISLVQATAILVTLGLVTTAPANIPVLALAVLATTAMMVALALATTGLTNSPEHAQVTTLPVSLSVIAVASWVGITGTDELGLVKRLLPGGSATELIVGAWNGGVPLSDTWPLLASSVGWVAVAVALSRRLFRWEPRR